MLGVVTWLLDKLLPPTMRRFRHPELEIERAEHAGWSMTDPSKVYVNVALTLRNTGPTTAESFRAVARVRRGEGVSLALRDPRNPGDASAHRKDGDDIIEWQSTEPWPSGHTRRIECRLHLRQGARVPIAVTLRAPHMRPTQREIVVFWPASEPVIELHA